MSASYCHLYAQRAMLVIVTHKCFLWVGLLIASLPQQLSVFSGTLKARLHEGCFQLRFSSNMQCLQQQGLTLDFWRAKEGNRCSLSVWRNHLDCLNQTLLRKWVLTGIETFVRLCSCGKYCQPQWGFRLYIYTFKLYTHLYIVIYNYIIKLYTTHMCVCIYTMIYGKYKIISFLEASSNNLGVFCSLAILLLLY